MQHCPDLGISQEMSAAESFVHDCRGQFQLWGDTEFPDRTGPPIRARGILQKVPPVFLGASAGSFFDRIVPYVDIARPSVLKAPFFTSGKTFLELYVHYTGAEIVLAGKVAAYVHHEPGAALFIGDEGIEMEVIPHYAQYPRSDTVHPAEVKKHCNEDDVIFKGIEDHAAISGFLTIMLKRPSMESLFHSRSQVQVNSPQGKETCPDMQHAFIKDRYTICYATRVASFQVTLDI